MICLLPAVRVLREVGQLLVDVNGQHAALSLKDGATRVRCACCGRPSASQGCSTRFVRAIVDEKSSLWQARHVHLTRELTYPPPP